jgi:polyhydroxyalkanoate synthesis regulator phasin
MSRPFTFEDIQKMADAKTLERVKEYITKTEVDSRSSEENFTNARIQALEERLKEAVIIL